jgi:hypothetical protein
MSVSSQDGRNSRLSAYVTHFAPVNFNFYNDYRKGGAGRYIIKRELTN